jgi:cell division initiation protein
MFDPALSEKRAAADNDVREGSPKRTTMNVSPLDLRQQRFRNAFRGFDKIEVTSFLLAVADDYEQALRETDRLRQELARMEGVLEEHRQHEQNLKTTLFAAQKLSDDIKAHADDEARRIVREAQGRSDLLLEKTQSRLEDVQREIDGMKMKRKDVETTLESTIQTLRNTLEYVREQEQRERDERILLHRPRHQDSSQDSRDQNSSGTGLQEARSR